MTASDPGFSLPDLDGLPRQFPSGRPTLVCFVKEDCKTCNLVMPVLEAFHRAFGARADVLLVGQSATGNATLKERHALTMPVLDDGDCRVSFEWDFEIVPAVFWTDGEGRVGTRFEGFVRSEWQGLEQQIGAELDLGSSVVNWPDYPEWRPGCGSKHLDPEVNERLRATASDSPIRARRIEIASADDDAEFMFDQGFSDGLPLVPPTPERVMRMLAGTRRGAQDIVAVVAPNMAPATVE